MSIPLKQRLMMSLLILLSANSLYAAQLVEVADGSVVSVRVSGNEPNRLVIRDGRVHKVWGAEGKVILKPDNDTGQLYLQPADTWRTRSFSMFVKDDLGGVYTLIVNPTDMPSETITLLRPERSRGGDRVKAVSWESDQPYERTLLEIIRQMALEETPEGYSYTKVNRLITLWQEAEIRLKSRYVGGRLEGEVYELANVDSKKMRLDEREFYRPGVLAVAVDKHELAPGERTNIYLIVGANAQ